MTDQPFTSRELFCADLRAAESARRLREMLQHQSYWRPILRDHTGRVISYRARARRPWWAPWRGRWCYLDWLAGDLWAAVRPDGGTTYHEPRAAAAASLVRWL